MNIIRKKLSPDEISPPGLRYNEECDCVQQTPDNGETWIDNPGADPRHGDGFRLPARTGGDPQCDAAANMVAFIHEYIDGIISTVSLIQEANAILLIFAVLTGGAGILVDLILVIVEAMLTIGVTELDDAFTEEVYDQIKCIIFVNIDPDGQMSAEQLAIIDSQINSVIGGLIVPVAMDLTLRLWGEVGLSNAGVQGDETGDCDDCAWCYEWLDTAELLAESWTHDTDFYYSSHWNANWGGKITRVEFGYTWNGLDGSGAGSHVFLWKDQYATLIQRYLPLNTSPGSPFVWEGEEDISNGIQWGLNTNGIEDGTVSTTYLKISGIGARPNWSHGHVC